MIIETSDRLPSNNYKLSIVNIQNIIGAYRLGQSGTSLAKTYRVAAGTIYYHLRRNNIPTRGRGKAKAPSISTQAAKRATAALAKFTPEEIKAAKVLLKHL